MSSQSYELRIFLNVILETHIVRFTKNWGYVYIIVVTYSFF